jgi:hypothetical protein
MAPCGAAAEVILPMTTLEYFVHLIVYESLLLVGSGVPLGLVLALVDTVSEGPVHFLLDIVALVSVLAFLACFFGGSWVAHNAARKRVFENEGFFEALQSAFSEARLYMSFVPVVGKVFRRQRPVESRFENPPDHRFE